MTERLQQQTEKAPVKITSSELARINTPLNMGNVYYMPHSEVDPHTMPNIGRYIEKESWFERLLEENKDFVCGPENPDAEFRNIIRNALRVWPEGREKDDTYYRELTDKLFDLYAHYKFNHEGQEPTWFLGLDTETQKFLSFKLIWDNIDKFPLHLRTRRLPYSGINETAIEEESMFEDLFYVFRLRRLSAIRQLAFKRDPLPKPGKEKEDFYHTRYVHVFDVLKVANLLGANAKLSAEDLKVLQIAAVSHDYRTPAGGDTTKMADLEAFDEDKHYNEIFDTKEWQEFAAQYGITKGMEEKIYRTILGEGLLGQLLDIADKTGYVARDADIFLDLTQDIRRQITNKFGNVNPRDNPGYRAIVDLLYADPKVCSLWGSVDITDGKVVIGDGTRLADFLKLRALLFRHLYYDFNSRSGVDMFVQKLTTYLYRTGELTKDFLLNSLDSDLESKLNDFMGSKMFPNLVRHEHGEIREFATLEEARMFAKTLENDEERLAIIDDFPIVTSPNTKKFLVKKDGKVLYFNEAYPKEAKEIEDIMVFPSSVKVYIATFSDLGIPFSHQQKIKEAFKAE